MNTLKAVLIGVVVLGAVVSGAVWNKRHPKTTSDAYSTESPSPSATASASPIISITPNTMNDRHEITITTTLGDIVFRTYDADAPKTVENFVTLAGKKFYENVVFHRVIKGFMIQGGDPTGTGAGGPGYKFADELDPNTESAKRGYVKGTVAMANAGPNTNGSQFFIMHADYPLPHNYTIFGHVVSGQEVVDAIASVKTDASDRPLTPVVMKSVTIKDLP
jgi:cyclophilin family peptidyl-prolyl cis-trans isomerase